MSDHLLHGPSDSPDSPTLIDADEFARAVEDDEVQAVLWGAMLFGWTLESEGRDL